MTSYFICIFCNKDNTTFLKVVGGILWKLHFKPQVKLTISLLMCNGKLNPISLSQLIDLMDVLREIPGREALKLRAEVC